MAKLITLDNLSTFKSKLPTFLDGENFVRTTTTNLANYYKKTETYSKGEVQDLIDAVKQFNYEIVTSLPTAGAGTMGTIYLVLQTGGTTNDSYNEYITLNKGTASAPSYVWEKIGDTRIDLSNYSTTEQMNTAIASAVAPFKTEAQIKTIVESYGYITSTTAANSYVAKVSGKGLSTNDYTTTEKTKLAGIAAGAEVNQNAFANIVSGGNTISASEKSDSITIAGGDNVTVSVNSSNKSVTISATDTTYNNATTSQAGLMSATDKAKLDGIATGANNITVDSTLSSSSTNPVQNKVINTALENKVDKVSGKGLSTNDYTTTDKNKLAGIETGAEVNTVRDVTLDGTTVLEDGVAKFVTATTAEINALFN